MQRWDTVVIGSGAGGLTAAVALARAGQSVLVLEQHYLPGGWTQSFSLGGYRFSPGVHYIGECGPGGGMRRLYEGLGLTDDLAFCEMNPDGFDHVRIGPERFDIPKGFDRYVTRLVDRFPRERSGIERYFAVIRALTHELQAVDSMLDFPRVLAVPFRAPTLVLNAFRTQESLLARTIRNPLLRAILSAQNGDHGLAPSRVSLPLHASTIAHYFNGAYYPRGGAKRIPMAMIRALRKRGGHIRLRANVTAIRLERGRVSGVELDGGEFVRTDHVVSNADPYITYGKLLPRGVSERERKRVARAGYSVSMISVYCAVDLDLRSMGYDSGNYWYYRDEHVGELYERMEERMPGATVDGVFLAITSLKDPGHAPKGHHTIEMFTFVPYAPFARWKDTQQGRRGLEYDRFKERLGDAVVAAAENIIPGLSKHIVFRAVGTPVTNDFYCRTPFGAAYGTRKTPFQLGPFSFSSTSSVPGLYQCGASTLSHGVAGACLSGLAAARAILGVERVEDLLGPADGSLRIFPADRPEEWLTQAPELGKVA